VRALTKRERIGALIADAMDMMDKLLDALLSRRFWWERPPCLEFWSW